MKWIESCIGETFMTEDFCEELADGVALCKLMNTITPNCIPKIRTKKLAMLLMENSRLYLEQCIKLGMESSDLFSASDLYKKD
eukprot:Pgem_evm1s15463